MSSSDGDYALSHTPELDMGQAQTLIGQFLAADLGSSEPPVTQEHPEQTIEVIVPVLDRETLEEYSYLPGHFSVDEVLSQTFNIHGEEIYETRLKSGEVESYSAAELLSLRHGERRLNEFNRKSPSIEVDRNGRPRRTRTAPDRQGLIDLNAISLSSDDELQGDKTIRALRRSARKRSTRSARDYSSEIESHIESGEESADSSPPRRRSRRLLSQHEVGSSSDDYSIVRRTRRKRQLSFGQTGLRKFKRIRETVPAREGTRRSERQRKPVASMVDDISEVDAKVTSTKYRGARERFTRISKDDPFRLRHRAVCVTCDISDDDPEKGPLVFCQGCTSAYHQVCLGPRGVRHHLVTKVNTGEFVLQCRRCLGVARDKKPLAPHHGHCSQCNEPGPLTRPLREKLPTRQEHIQREANDGNDPVTNVDMSLINNVNNVMFRCASCERSWHMKHLPARQQGSQSFILQDSEKEENEEDIVMERFKEYSRRWECNECANAPADIEALIAWRPVDLDSFIPGSTSDVLEETAKEYLVKWRKLSYFRTSWMPGAWVWGVTAANMRKAFEKSSKRLKPMMTSEDAIPEEFLHIDIIFELRYSNVVTNRTMQIDLARINEVEKVYAKYKGLQYEDAVWEKPPRPQDTERWQSFQRAYEEWVRRQYVHVPRPSTLSKHIAAARSKDFATQLLKQQQPSILTGGQLMDYQKDGLNWIYYMWYKEQNAILADEMGLGKTIQVIAFLATLIEDHHCWPFLVVVPNSTCQNWRSEIQTWAPTLQVVTYYGSAAARKLAHDHEMFPGGGSDLRAHVVITSYETAIDDKAKRIFSSIPWVGLVVDEGHRLKSDKNQLYEALSRLNFPFKLLLTGTPLQNNVRELFNILQFVDPSKNAEELEAQYSELTREAVAELHDLIRPFFLRRTKNQVLNFLPPVAQIIVPVTMTVVQKKLYKSILAKNPQLIKSVFQREERVKKSERHNLNNILMQLRKCLCHPFVYSKAIEEHGVSATLLHRNLVEASSKLQLLELLLPKLQERGHRVLIFSQFLDFLDIIEDFLDGLGLLHLRLDGSFSSLRKQKQIDEFNAPGSPYFAFLLSTRAGGVGINLATADTVIIMDPDFNPHQDIQALSRAHRIGQQKKVLVFQLMTRNSAEEKIMQIGRKKMALDHVLIERMDAEDDAGEDIESILRHGAETLFDNDDSGDIHYDAQSVEKLLDRSQAENTKVGTDASAESQFSFARVWVNDTAAMQDDLGTSESATPNSSVWEKILKERERAAEEEARAKAEAFGRGKRKRRAVDYSLPPQSPSHSAKRVPESDEEFHTVDEGSDDTASIPQSTESTPDSKGESTKKSDSALARPFQRAIVPAPKLGIDETSELSERCIACDEFHEVGYCPLKRAGVEHCGLCGIAHYGYSRTCPHLNSEIQVAAMLGSLKHSTEPRALVEEATRYLRGIRGDLVRRKKLKASREQQSGANPPPITRVAPRPAVAPPN
ncbi:hypothetical protein VTO42DRAFT_2848 [Malbranchea cinnamomea]